MHRPFDSSCSSGRKKTQHEPDPDIRSSQYSASPLSTILFARGSISTGAASTSGEWQQRPQPSGHLRPVCCWKEEAFSSMDLSAERTASAASERSFGLEGDEGGGGDDGDAREEKGRGAAGRRMRWKLAWGNGGEDREKEEDEEEEDDEEDE
mmetsp:Transcript_9761/g.24023  ORF Transcript_9761/g.24023 Transcript_9761/m.24023 type:complete len:152 (+) Transcript_9761:550-1005(+)